MAQPVGTTGEHTQTDRWTNKLTDGQRKLKRGSPASPNTQIGNGSFKNLMVWPQAQGQMVGRTDRWTLPNILSPLFRGR